MKALSLWQPWATAIAAGVKQIETRGWATNYRGPLAIHAAKRNSAELREWWHEHLLNDSVISDHAAFARLQIWGFNDLPMGAVVATCRLVDCVPSERLLADGRADSREQKWGNFGPERFGWVLADVAPLVTPIPLVGRQGLFEWRAGE